MGRVLSAEATIERAKRLAETCVLSGYRLDKDGYALVPDGRTPSGTVKYGRGHRVAWAKVHGRIPDGFDIDHLCRNRACINAEHFELVTRGENVLRGLGFMAMRARQKTCLRGHPYTRSNLRREADGRRRCKACHRLTRRGLV